MRGMRHGVIIIGISVWGVCSWAYTIDAMEQASQRVLLCARVQQTDRDLTRSYAQLRDQGFSERHAACIVARAAAYEGRTTLLQNHFLPHMYDVDDIPEDGSGKTCLMCAAQKGHVDAVRLLLARGASVDRRDVDNKHVGMYAIEGAHHGVLELCAAAGAFAPARMPVSAAQYAIQIGQTHALRFFIDRDKTTRVDHGEFDETLLMRAAQTNRVDMVRMLLRRGVQARAVDRFGSTALHHAVMHKAGAGLKLLVEAGLSPYTPDHAGCTALDWAVSETPYADECAVVHFLARCAGDVQLRRAALERAHAYACALCKNSAVRAEMVCIKNDLQVLLTRLNKLAGRAHQQDCESYKLPKIDLDRGVT